MKTDAWHRGRARLAFGLIALVTGGCGEAVQPTIGQHPGREMRPPPVSGGTLLALRAGGRAVLSDLDEGVIRVVDLKNQRVERTIWLEPGADPGRLAEDAAGRVHVALRGTGEVLTFDPNSGAPVFRRHVCRAPRGLAVDPASGGLVVACLEGVLVELPPDGETPERVTFVDTDLRDVVFAGAQLVVTRFRSAEVLYLDAQRSITLRRVLVPNRAGAASNVAWRAVAAPDGSIVVVHQRAGTGVIDPGPPGTGGATSTGTGGTGGSGVAGAGAGAGSVPVYYGTGVSCGAIVNAGISILDQQGNYVTSPNLGGATLPVDLAVAPDGSIAVANGASNGMRPYVLEYARQSITDTTSTCAVASRIGRFSGSFGEWAPAASAVAFEPITGELLVHRRGRAALETYPEGAARLEISLEWRNARYVDNDATLGHDLFHFDTGLGISCASCHPEGTDDGHVWNFSKGPRRTQPLDVRVRAPFHWNGEFASFDALVDDIFELRMGAGNQSPEHVAALAQFVGGLRPRPPIREPMDEAALRGRELFDARCANCHAGRTFTIGENVDIGKGPPTQVPSLLGVGVRAPFMHDGCAKALPDRFEPTCGGTLHGDVSGLDDAGRADLVAYLESL